MIKKKNTNIMAKPFETSRIKEKESNIDQYVRFFFISVLKELSKMCLSNDSNGHFYFKIK